MLKLFILNSILIAVIVLFLTIVKKTITGQKGKQITLLISSLLTVGCHYSSLLYHFLKDGSAMDYLKSNPNLILPIYPCNVVMWGCVIFGIIKNRNSKLSKFLADYLFFFGVVSALIGMFVNVDFIMNPSFANYDVTKGILSHAFMLFNVLLIAVFGYIKIDFPKNYRNILISMVMMFLIGCYCNLVFLTITTKDFMLLVNSMFLLKSPFEGARFIKYPFICLISAVLYFIVFNICELFAYKKGQRWISRYIKHKKSEEL